MKVLLSFALSLVILSGVGFAYSQNDTIPTWIKKVAEFWAEDKITDQEFIEALEFMIETKIIKVNDPKIIELEKEILESRQKIESLQSEKSQPKTVEPMPQQDKNELAYITVDKQEYGLGDTIKVSGFIDRFLLDELYYHQETLGGIETEFNIQQFRVVLNSQDHGYSGSQNASLSCARAHEYHLREDANLVASGTLEVRPNLN